MDKIYKCISCGKQFKVYEDPENPEVSRQHDVEQNISCPFCDKSNPIVWPLDGWPRAGPAS